MILSQGKTYVKDKPIDFIIFQIEELKKPADLLKEQTIEEVLSKFSPKIEAYSDIEIPLISNGFHSFIYGMYQAYSGHRPFVLSPDMIWLLICQGFSRHINFNKGTENEILPHLNTRQTLVIVNNNIKLGDKSSPWIESTHQFTQEIAKKIGEDLVEVLRADFSTTGVSEKVASEITILDSMKPYFEYILDVTICGIPEITLEGSTEDWRKLLKKLLELRKYKLDWWISRLEPVLEEFVSASRGKINTGFWINMFKVHKTDEYGHPEYIDGWITKFYPYDRKGKLINLSDMKMLTVKSICEELPKELVCVDFIYRILDNEGNILNEIPMEYWAGFIGLRQHRENYSLRPEISWFVCYKNTSISNESKFKHKSHSKVYYNLTRFPTEVFNTKKWERLILNFKNEIIIPMKILELSIEHLELNGRLSMKEKMKLLLLKMKFKMTVNGEDF